MVARLVCESLVWLYRWSSFSCSSSAKLFYSRASERFCAPLGAQFRVG